MSSCQRIIVIVQDKIAFRKDRLRSLREQRGWSQRELARQCGFADSMIRKYEAGETDPSATYLRIMAEKFEVSADYLLGLTNDLPIPISTSDLSEDETVLVQAFRKGRWKGVIQVLADHLAE